MIMWSIERQSGPVTFIRFPVTDRWVEAAISAEGVPLCSAPSAYEQQETK